LPSNIKAYKQHTYLLVAWGDCSSCREN